MLLYKANDDLNFVFMEAVEADNCRFKKIIRQIHGKHFHKQILQGIVREVPFNILNPTIADTGKV